MGQGRGDSKVMHRTARIAVWVAVAGAGLLAAYARLVRPWALRWGATAEEAARPLPGDGLVAKADYVATRAITIDAPPHQVWPWLVQIGSGRAGWYTYDRLDNAGVPSAIEIVPDFQHLQVGDVVMQRKLLRGIKQRAERLAAHRTTGQEPVQS
jgi:hypothetical protein